MASLNPTIYKVVN